MFHSQLVKSKLLLTAASANVLRGKNTAKISHLEEVFDLRIVVSFLLNQRGTVQLTRTESAHTDLENSCI